MCSSLPLATAKVNVCVERVLATMKRDALMHDWTLLSVIFEWEDAHVVVRFRSEMGEEKLVAVSTVDLHVPQVSEWGSSVSVNSVMGPVATEGGHQSIEIEMQSGDVIRIVASSFEMPNTKDATVAPTPTTTG